MDAGAGEPLAATMTSFSPGDLIFLDPFEELPLAGNHGCSPWWGTSVWSTPSKIVENAWLDELQADQAGTHYTDRVWKISVRRSVASFRLFGMRFNDDVGITLSTFRSNVSTYWLTWVAALWRRRGIGWMLDPIGVVKA